MLGQKGKAQYCGANGWLKNRFHTNLPCLTPTFVVSLCILILTQVYSLVLHASCVYRPPCAPAFSFSLLLVFLCDYAVLSVFAFPLCSFFLPMYTVPVFPVCLLCDPSIFLLTQSAFQYAHLLILQVYDTLRRSLSDVFLEHAVLQNGELIKLILFIIYPPSGFHLQQLIWG